MNLGDQTPRTQRQSSRVSNRNSIIPARRETRAPAIETNASLRSARRGDVGGADALLKTLGILEQGVGDFQAYTANQHATDERDNIARGAADQAAGAIDDEMMEKSLGYRNAVTKGRTVTGFTKATREFAEELDEIIEQQDSPLLEERRAEALERTEQFFSNFAVDPESGELREYLQSPGAMRYLGESIQTARPQFEINALSRIEERFNQEALSHFSQNVVDQVEESGTFDVEAARSLLPDTVTDEQVADTLILSVFNAYDALRAEGRRDEALKLIAGLRGRTDTPLPSGPPTAIPSGSPVSPEVASGALRMPVQGRVTSEFGAKRGKGSHNGVDIAVPVGTPVPAAMGGEIVRVWNSDRGGLSVKVKYDDGTIAGFAHLSEQPIQDGRFNPGDVIAVTGNTGRSTGPHLHYTLTRDGKKVDPLGAEVGEGFAAAPSSAPIHRLTDPNADPVTALETAGEIAEITGLEGLNLSAGQVARINQFYSEASSDLRREWVRADEERHSENATSLMLGLVGANGRTTLRDISAASERGDISPDQLLMLTRAFETKRDRIEARQDRLESRAEREEHRRAIRGTEAATESLIGRMVRGELSPAETRQAALVFAGDFGDPEVSASVISSVASAANSYESAIQNSAPVRTAMSEYRELAEDAASYVATLPVPQYRRTVAAEAFVDILDRAQARLLKRVMDGEDPAAAREAVEAWVVQQEAKMVAQLNPGQLE